MRVAWLVALGACGAPSGGRTPDAMPDAPPPIAYDFGTFEAEPMQRPPSPNPPTVFIDGVATTDVMTTYPDDAELRTATHHVELRAGDVVVAQLDVAEQGAVADCDLNTGGVALTWRETICAFDSGDLRYGFVDAMTTTGVCAQDGFCDGCPSCPAGQRCTARAALLDPMFSRYDCAPIGTQALGEPCAFTSDPAGAYDDCGDGLVCVAGTCRTQCFPGDPTSCTGCDFVVGYPPEVGVCP